MKRPRPTLESITLHHELDTDPDTSFLGTYTDDVRHPWHILREAGEYIANLPADYELPERGRDYRAFKPEAGGEPEGSPDYQKYGKQDYARMESLEQQEWYFLGIYAKATVRMPSDTRQVIRSSGLWGIESDSNGSHFREVENEQVHELTADLRAIGIPAATIRRVIAAGVKVWDV